MDLFYQTYIAREDQIYQSMPRRKPISGQVDPPELEFGVDWAVPWGPFCVRLWVRQRESAVCLLHTGAWKDWWVLTCPARLWRWLVGPVRICPNANFFGAVWKN